MSYNHLSLLTQRVVSPPLADPLSSTESHLLFCLSSAISLSQCAKAGHKIPSPCGSFKTMGLVYLFSFLPQCEALWNSEENFPRGVKWCQANWKLYDALASGCPASHVFWDILCVLLVVIQTNALGMERPWSLRNSKYYQEQLLQRALAHMP